VQRFESVTHFAEALLPFACERTRRLWLSRHQREGVPGAQLLSGAYRELPGEQTRVTPVLLPRPKRDPRETFTPAFAALTCCLLVLGVGIGHLRSRTAAEAELGASSAHAQELPEVVEVGALVRPSQRVYVSPRDATVSLDGAVLGQGEFSLPLLADDAVHELRVTAGGYVPRVVLFRKTLDTVHIALEPPKLAER
jgi:hypothetical protein